MQISLWGKHTALLLILESEIVKLKWLDHDKLKYVEKSKNWSDCPFTPLGLFMAGIRELQIRRRLEGKSPSKSLHLTAPFTVKATETQRGKHGPRLHNK